ncbi:MAG: Ig-like domain-containing protein [Dysgonamonadaceae bacterium]|nr:Ig-like domain-containing protein [Dysgonamonadaceae bacterium]
MASISDSTATITAHQDGNAEYLAATASITLTVDKATLTVTPDAGQHKSYGEDDPEFTCQVSGWKYEDAANATGILSGALSRASGSNAGVYSLTQGTLSAGSNYDIQFIPGVKFTIDKADQSITGFLPADTAILLGDQINLTAISSSDLPVTYESSNTDTATINGNLITAVGLGTTVITANQAGDNNYNPAPALTCTLTVVSVLVPVTDVSLNEHTLELLVGESETLTATVSPDNATNHAVIWRSNNESVATVNNGLVHAVGEGSAWITATATSDYDSGIADSCLVTVTGATGISTVDESSSVTVGFSDCTLYIDSPAAEQIEVYSISGKLLHRVRKRAGKASFTVSNSEWVLIIRGSSGWVKRIITD